MTIDDTIDPLEDIFNGDETRIMYKNTCQGYKWKTHTIVQPHEYLDEKPPHTDPKTGLKSHGLCGTCADLYKKDAEEQK